MRPETDFIYGQDACSTVVFEQSSLPFEPLRLNRPCLMMQTHSGGLVKPGDMGPMCPYHRI